MELEDITLETLFEKVTYSSDLNPENKLVVSNGTFVQDIILLKLINKLEHVRLALMK